LTVDRPTAPVGTSSIAEAVARGGVPTADLLAVFQDILEGTMAGIAVHDGADAFCVNDAFVRIMGFADREAATARGAFRELLPDELARRSEHAWAAVMRGSVRRARTIPLYRADGGAIWVDVVSRPVQWDGRPAIVSTVIDVTSRILIAEESIGRRLAEAAGTARANFVANLSHELRNPLNAILGFSEIIRESTFGPLPERYRVYGNDIFRAARHLYALVSDLLDLSRIDAGRVDLEPVPIDLVELVEDCRNQIGGRAMVGSVKLEVVQRAVAADVVSDPLRLRQILLNILSNAVKFSPPGSVVRIEIDGPDDRGAVAAIIVVDQGPGMNRDQLARAFNPYSQPVGTSGQRREGAGLGLAITNGLARALGIRFGLESEPGQGTTAILRLPAVPPGVL
jgi:PAS domain S-box-containing protein